MTGKDIEKKFGEHLVEIGYPQSAILSEYQMDKASARRVDYAIRNRAGDIIAIFEIKGMNYPESINAGLKQLSYYQEIQKFLCAWNGINFVFYEIIGSDKEKIDELPTYSQLTERFKSSLNVSFKQERISATYWIKRISWVGGALLSISLVADFFYPVITAERVMLVAFIFAMALLPYIYELSFAGISVKLNSLNNENDK